MPIAPRGFVAAAILSLVLTGTAVAAEVNVYSSRHYDVDRALYAAFTESTGITVKLIEGTDDLLLERLKTEGANSPADVLVTVDAGRLWRAQEAGLLQPVRSAVLDSAIPPHLREAGGHWFGLSKRARVIVHDKTAVPAGAIARYEDLADPKWKGRVLIRSSTSVYNQSLAGSLIAAHGVEATLGWAKGVVANLARKPQGGDTDQLRAIAAGEGDIAVTNTYYLGRIAASDKPEDKALAARLAVVFPNQSDRGTHVNVSGAGVAAHAPHRAEAVRFIEFLASPQAQKLFADGNFEYPAVPGVAPHPVVAAWGPFKEDTLNAAVYGRNNAEALKTMDRAGWR